MILDLYSRKVVGWSISKNNDSALVCSSISRALEKRNPPKGLIFHSDRGSNYCSRETRELLINTGFEEVIVEKAIAGIMPSQNPSSVLLREKWIIIIFIGFKKQNNYFLII
ncbi:integrase core domain protein [Leptospira weilii serovar Topaz str. LT2116]|uniref:Integrase core domain protein n=1 Tax=Leptospira weilii serovar Topaz str. LT2116 TaxID=1088540 RepID=M3GE31_9LEPT|nr:integrase core domain protein [Leptospira weilii serovar Topaz str. LT2116]